MNEGQLIIDNIVNIVLEPIKLIKVGSVETAYDLIKGPIQVLSVGDYVALYRTQGRVEVRILKQKNQYREQLGKVGVDLEYIVSCQICKQRTNEKDMLCSTKYY